MAKKILIALFIVALALPLSSLAVVAQPSTDDVSSLDLSELELWSDSTAQLRNHASPMFPSKGLGQSDLTLSSDDISFTPASPTTADVITINADISNVGTSSARNVVVRFSDSDGVIGSKTIRNLRAGKTATASIEWGSLTEGTHIVDVVVDPDNSISESDENNNAASSEVTVSEGGTPPPPPPNKWAVVIGIADYQGQDADLWHPDEDAKEMKKALINNYGFPDENILMLLNRNATAQAIVDAIDWLAANEDADSTVVFFYSGHGGRAPDAAGLDDDLEADGYDEGIVSHDLMGLTDSYLGYKFSTFDSTRFALIFCSCHSGGMFDDDDNPYDDLQAEGRVICAACMADQYGWDYLQLGNTLFGFYFVDNAILGGLADVNGDGVSMEEALNYAYPLVVAEQPDSQPQIYDGYAGELIL